MKRLKGGNILLDLSNFVISYDLSTLNVLNDETIKLKKFIESNTQKGKLFTLKIAIFNDDGEKVIHLVNTIPSISKQALYFPLYSDIDAKLVTMEVTFAKDGKIQFRKY